MKITIHSTSKVVEFVTGNGSTVQARVWEGETETGIKVNAFITRLVPLIRRDHPQQDEFQKQLQECQPPSATANVWPSRLIL